MWAEDIVERIKVAWWPTLEFRQEQEALIVCAIGRSSGLHKAAYGAAFAVIGIGIWYMDLPAGVRVAFVLGILGLGLYGLLKNFGTGDSMTVTLTVTGDGIESNGYGPNGYSPSYGMRASSDLTFIDGNSEDENSYPGGLYDGRICIVPNISEEQAVEIIAAIYGRFPDTGRDVRVGGAAKSSGLTLLDLANGAK